MPKVSMDPDETASRPEDRRRAARVRFVLVEPQLEGNVGATARALKNLGFGRLHLVAPRCDPRGDEARRFAREAAELLDRAQVDDDLDTALAGAAVVIATSRRTGKHRQPHWRLDRLAPELPRLVDAGELAVVLGREAHGLSDDELDRATHLVHFPSSAEYPSFNLAQSALLMAYELRLALLRESQGEPLARPAEHAEREAMFVHLERALRAIGFLHEQTAEPMMRRLRRMFGKALLTPEEVKIVRGIARQTTWVARQAGLHAPDPDDGPEGER